MQDIMESFKMNSLKKYVRQNYLKSDSGLWFKYFSVGGRKRKRQEVEGGTQPSEVQRGEPHLHDAVMEDSGIGLWAVSSRDFGHFHAPNGFGETFSCCIMKNICRNIWSEPSPDLEPTEPFWKEMADLLIQHQCLSS